MKSDTETGVERSFVKILEPQCQSCKSLSNRFWITIREENNSMRILVSKDAPRKNSGKKVIQYLVLYDTDYLDFDLLATG